LGKNRYVHNFTLSRKSWFFHRTELTPILPDRNTNKKGKANYNLQDMNALR